MNLELLNDEQTLIKLANTKMPFGKYSGFYLDELPEPYVVWLRGEGFPKGEIGDLLSLIYTVKENGLEPLIREIRNRYPRY